MHHATIKKYDFYYETISFYNTTAIWWEWTEGEVGGGTGEKSHTLTQTDKTQASLFDWQVTFRTRCVHFLAISTEL